MSSGLFLVLEGVEGAGKSTQARLLGQWLEDQGLPFLLTREPGGTPVGEAVRRVVLDREGLTMPAETELFLILAARAAFTREVVAPALNQGKVVVADRFDLSTFAYQGYGRGLDLSDLARANAMATAGLSPDLYMILDVPVAQGLARKGGVSSGDRIEKEGEAFLQQVHDGYRRLAREVPAARLVPGSGNPSRVQASIRDLLRATFPETFSDGEV